MPVKLMPLTVMLAAALQKVYVVIEPGLPTCIRMNSAWRIDALESADIVVVMV